MFALGRVFRSAKPMPPLTVETITPQEQAWFYQYKRDRVPAKSPAQVRTEMVSIFGAARTLELVALFETSAIPARPGEWRRRLH